MKVNRSVNRPEAVFFALSGAWTPNTAHIDDEHIKLDVVALEVVAGRHHFMKGQTIRVSFTWSAL